jgi:YVTN family beta-propeller protein
VIVRRSATAAAAALVMGAATACSGIGTTAGRSLASRPATTAPASASASGQPTPSPASSSAGIYTHAGAGMLSDVAHRAKPLVYVPNSLSNTVDVIDPASYRIVAHFRVGREPQHVVPSWDLKTLWVNDDRSNDLVPIDPVTGRPGSRVKVADPYNLYFTPDGRHALVMAERLGRIDVRDPHTMALQRSVHVPCHGVNHADFSADGTWMLASCEFSGKLLVIPMSLRQVAKVIDLSAIRTPGATAPSMARIMGGPAGSLDRGASSMPQDVRITADGRSFVVADMLRNGVWIIDAQTRQVSTFVPTGKGAHGIYPSRDATRLFVSNRDAGTISVLNATGREVVARWRLTKGASPDMGGVTADGSQLWLAGRYDSVVYVIDTATGRLLRTIDVGQGPHGLCVWPQPGRYSLGHTGNMR